MAYLHSLYLACNVLTHWGRGTHICLSRLTITGSDNGLSPGRHQAIIWTNAGTLLIGPLGTNFSENSIEILTFSFTKMRLKVSSAKWRPFCLGLNVLTSRSHTLLCSFSGKLLLGCHLGWNYITFWGPPRQEHLVLFFVRQYIPWNYSICYSIFRKGSFLSVCPTVLFLAIVAAILYIVLSDRADINSLVMATHLLLGDLNKILDK